MKWNMEVDRAIVSEVPEPEIQQIKLEYITDKVKQSIADCGSFPDLFRFIVNTAISKLATLISKTLDKAREMKEKLFSLPGTERYKPEPVAMTEQLISKTVVEPQALQSKPIVTEPIVADMTETIAPEFVKEVKSQMPPKPKIPPEAAIYPKLKKIDAELKQQNNIIFAAEHERNLLEIERDDLKGLARLTRKGELQRRIDLKNEEAEVLKKGLSGIARRYGFANVQEFYNALRASEDAYRKYQKDLSKWEETYGEKSKTKEETFSDKLQRYQKQVSEQGYSRSSSHSGRGAR